MPELNLQTTFTGMVLIIAPHMDDEALACGGLIALLPDKERIHIVYATDGMKSPAPIFPGRDSISPDLGKVRVHESIDAMTLLGVPEHNLHFLCLPEAMLSKNRQALQSALMAKIEQINPDQIVLPFRFDRHPDHLAVNHVVASGVQQGRIKARVIEYFVYYRWRLMPKRRIQKYIQPQYLYSLDIQPAAALKRKSLACFTSQTTIYYPWQTRPILTPSLLDEECQNPEYFLIANTLSGASVFSNAVLWIRIAHRLEPLLLRWKYLTFAYLKRLLHL
jgi:LmbE family N-acetylglucosaminyl deacetylase